MVDRQAPSVATTKIGGRLPSTESAPDVPSAATAEKQPCSGCGYMMRGGSLCGDCREYGPPRDWRWEYDPPTGKHKRVPRVEAATVDRAIA